MGDTGMRLDKLAVLVLEISLRGICRLKPRGATAGLLGVTGPDAMLKSSFEERLLSTNDGDGDSMDLKSWVDQGRRFIEAFGRVVPSTSASSGSSSLPFSFPWMGSGDSSCDG